jgi:hypothetical protein
MTIEKSEKIFIKTKEKIEEFINELTKSYEIFINKSILSFIF